MTGWGTPAPQDAASGRTPVSPAPTESEHLATAPALPRAADQGPSPLLHTRPKRGCFSETPGPLFKRQSLVKRPFSNSAAGAPSQAAGTPAHRPDAHPYLVGKSPEVSHVCTALRPSAAPPGGPEILPGGSGTRFRPLQSTGGRADLLGALFRVRGAPRPPGPGGSPLLQPSGDQLESEGSPEGLPPRTLRARPCLRPPRGAPRHPAPRRRAHLPSPHPSSDPGPRPGPPLPAPRAPRPASPPAPPHGRAARPPPQPAQARASPAARPPPGGSIPASPGPLRGAREGSHPQPPLARGRLGPQLAKQRQWRWRPEKARRRRRRGHAASRPSMGLSGTASPSLAPRRGARGRRTANPGRPRAGAQWRPASAPRGALGLGVRLPERRGPTSPGRPRGRAGPGGAGAGRPRVEPLRPPAARPHLGGPGPGFPPGPAGLTPAASGPGSVLECY